MEWVYYLLKQKLAVGKNLIIQTRLNNESSGSASLAPYLSALLTSDWARNSINSRLTHSILFYTVCKFSNFSATQILREIKFQSCKKCTNLPKSRTVKITMWKFTIYLLLRFNRKSNLGAFKQLTNVAFGSFKGSEFQVWAISKVSNLPKFKV